MQLPGNVLLLSVAVLTSINAIYGAETVSPKPLETPPPAGLFQGYSSVDGSGLSTAINGTYVTAGGTSSVTYTVCDSTESIYQALDISQSAFVGVIPFFGIREKTSFVSSLKQTSYDITIVVRASHVKGTDTATYYHIKSGIEPPVGDNQTREFFRLYGDSFVSSLTTGSEYYATFTFHSRSSEERQSTMTAITTAGLFGFGLIGADFKQKIDDLTATSKVEVTFSQNVAGITNPVLPSPDNLVQYALDFPSIPIDSPAIISFDSTGYEHVPGVNNFDVIVANRDYFNGGVGVEGLSTNILRLDELLNDIEDLQSIYEFYKFADDQKLIDAKNSGQSDVDAINGQIRNFLYDPLANFTRPPLGALKLGSPQLQYSIGQSPQWGGGGGSPFDDVDINSHLQRQTRITSLKINTGTTLISKKYIIKRRRKYRTTVFQLTVTYATKDGSTRTVTHGTGGSPSSVLQLGPGQLVIGVAGRAANEVDQLQLTVGDGRTVVGGGTGGSPFSWTVPDGAVLLGFVGRSASRLDRVGVVYATLLPAKWE